AQSIAELRITQHPVERAYELVASVDEQPAESVRDGVAVPGDSSCHRGRPARARLGDRHPPSLARSRARHDPRPPVQTEQLVVADVAAETHPAVGPRLPQLRLEILAAVSLSHDDRLEARLVLLDADEHLDELLETLHGNEATGGHDERRRRLRVARR